MIALPASLRRVRLFLPLLAVAIAAIGIAYISSASYDAKNGAFRPYARQQAVWLGVSLAGFAAALVVPYPRIERHAYILYGAGLALLAGLPFFGSMRGGARSWYNWGPVAFEPSEVAKLALVAATAKLLMYRRDLHTWRGFAAPFVLAAPALALILKQPDLGTTMITTGMLFAMLFAAGARLRHLAIVFGAAALALPLVYHAARASEQGFVAKYILKPHQMKRIDMFLNPLADVRSAGYQAYQSLLSVGSGGLAGQGWGEGPQTQLHALPENHTDFIFAVVGEEGGFLAATLLLGLLFLLAVGCLEVAWRTREPFGRLVATGVAALFVGQVFVNAGMTVGLVPITGITLPFVSYGGSSLLTCFVALGLVVNVGMQKVPELGAQS